MIEEGLTIKGAIDSVTMNAFGKPLSWVIQVVKEALVRENDIEKTPQGLIELNDILKEAVSAMIGDWEEREMLTSAKNDISDLSRYGLLCNVAESIYDQSDRRGDGFDDDLKNIIILCAKLIKHFRENEGASAENIAYLVRTGVGPEKSCSNCGIIAAIPKQPYCWNCGRRLIHKE